MNGLSVTNTVPNPPDMFLAAALAMAESGWHVFPLRPGRKEPLTAHGQNDATVDPDQIRRWWTATPSANIGLACAPSGLYVVDIDVSEGKNGRRSWDALVAEHGQVPVTRTVQTWSGGFHIYYRMPAQPLSNTASKIGEHIDSRGNGYVVAPPSIIGGKRYWTVLDQPVADMPDWLEDLFRATPVRPAAARPAGIHLATVAPASDVHARVQQLGAELAAAPVGAGNSTAARIAYMVGQYVGAGQISPTDAEYELVSALGTWVYAHPADRDAMILTIRRQIESGARSPRAWEPPRYPVRAETGPATTDHAVALPADLESAVPTDVFTDAGQGRVLARDLPGVAYATGIGWLLWDGCRWREVEEPDVLATVTRHYAARFAAEVANLRDLLRRVADVQAAMASGADHEDRERLDAEVDRQTALVGQYRSLQNSSRLAGVIRGLRSAVLVDADRFDRADYLLNTPSGTVDLRTGVLRPCDPRDLITKVTAAPYRPGAVHPDWTAAQSALPPESAAWLQKRLGAAITGVQLADDVVFLAGPGSNGKSLFANDGLIRSLGDYAIMVQSSVIGRTTADSSSANPVLAQLRGARVALVEELPEEFALSTKALKEVAGTGTIVARRLYRDPMTFPATHTLLVNTNHQPTVLETDWGTWRRLTQVPFPYTFRARPTGPTERRGDPGLVRRMRSGADGQWEAILAWLVAGARAVIADPSALVIGQYREEDGRPDSIYDATQSWRISGDVLSAYAAEFLVADPLGEIARMDLVWHLGMWLRQQGQSPWSARLISSRMAQCPAFAGTTVGRASAVASLSRPGQGDVFTAGSWIVGSSELPTLSARPEVIRGLRYAG